MPLLLIAVEVTISHYPMSGRWPGDEKKRDLSGDIAFTFYSRLSSLLQDAPFHHTSPTAFKRALRRSPLTASARTPNAIQRASII